MCLRSSKYGYVFVAVTSCRKYDASMNHPADLTIDEYYRRAADGLPDLIKLMRDFHDELGSDQQDVPLFQSSPSSIAIFRHGIATSLESSATISALSTAAAIMSVEPGQQFEEAVHRQFNGHKTFSIINGLLAPHATLAQDSLVRKRIKSIYAAFREYFATNDLRQIENE